MASVNRLRLYDVNANKRGDHGAYHLSSPPPSDSYHSFSNGLNNNSNHSTRLNSNASSVSSGYHSRPQSATSPSLTSPLTLQTPSSTFTSPRSSGLSSPRSPALRSPLPSPFETPVNVETRHDIEYTRAPDTFPCGHVLCHNCVRKFMRLRHRSGYSRCPVCHRRVDDDAPLHAMGLSFGGSGGSTGSRSNSTASSPSSSFYDDSGPASPTTPHSHHHHHHHHDPEPSDPTPVSLLNNFGDIVEKFNGIQLNLRRLKSEYVQAKSMGMTFTNTQCHLCMESHGTLRVVQEFNKLAVKHERPNAWSNYFYRLQQGKVVTEFQSQVMSSCICVPCTYKELQLQNLPDLPALPNVDPQRNTQICLAEVGKIVARNAAPIMALQGKNIIEIDHTLRIRERADHFNFKETTEQIENMVKQQEESLIKMASKQIKDTGRLYHVKESNCVEHDMDETEV